MKAANQESGESKRLALRVRPGKGASILLMALGLMFLLFGLILTELGKAEAGDSEPSLWWAITAFEVLWVAGCGALVLFGALGLRRKGVSPVSLDVDSAPDFEQRLRQLDTLRRDGLISEEEFLRKREEIMRQPWL